MCGYGGGHKLSPLLGSFVGLKNFVFSTQESTRVCVGRVSCRYSWLPFVVHAQRSVDSSRPRSHNQRLTTWVTSVHGVHKTGEWCQKSSHRLLCNFSAENYRLPIRGAEVWVFADTERITTHTMPTFDVDTLKADIMWSQNNRGYKISFHVVGRDETSRAHTGTRIWHTWPKR